MVLLALSEAKMYKEDVEREGKNYIHHRGHSTSEGN
jgi:hypothetical protein